MIRALLPVALAGRTLKFGRVTLRGTIAINFYRLAHAARATASGTSS